MINMINNSGDCSCNSECCGVVKANLSDKRTIAIDFLYLDLNVCEPCRGTEAILDEAVKDVANILESTGVEVIVNKINVSTEELAIHFKFVSSPTVRINDRDIQLEVKESSCKTCSDLSGAETDCRVWIYHGKEYNVPPKGMIIEAILKEIYGGEGRNEIIETEYEIPKNLINFFSGMKGRIQEINSPCCTSSGSERCC